MHALALGQGGLARAAGVSASPRRIAAKRAAFVRCKLSEDYELAEKQRRGPPTLNLRFQGLGKSKEKSQGQSQNKNKSGYGGNAAAAAAEAAGKGKEKEKGNEKEEKQGGEGLMEMVDRLSEALGVSKGNMVLILASGALGLQFSASLLSSVEVVPFVPEAMQTVGVAYAMLVVSRIWQGRPVRLVPDSPIKAVMELVEGGQGKPPELGGDLAMALPADLDAAVKEALVRLASEVSNLAVEVKKLKVQGGGEAVLRMAAEKEALEAVAMQLAEERDSALAEVSGLKSAVMAMTERMRSLEELLNQELNQLREQNTALESVALQLAAERDAALEEVRQLKEVAAGVARLQQETQALEVVALQLAQERDAAMSDIGKPVLGFNGSLSQGTSDIRSPHIL